VHAVRANLVILVSQTLASAASLQQTALTLTSNKISVGYGGRIFNMRPEIIKHISGHHLGNNVSASLEEVEHILNGKRKSTQTQSASQEYVAAYQFFTAKRADIEQTLKTLVKPLSISSESFQTGIHFLGDNILAALQLGDMNHVSDEMSWIKFLLHAYERPDEELVNFMDAYAKAVNKHINGSGKPIYEWLSSEALKAKTK
jgi:hypothetical protein